MSILLGPMIVVDPVVPWLIHMLAVGLATFVLAGRVKWRVVSFGLAMNLGLALIWSLAYWGHRDSWYYWREIKQQFHPGKIASDPVEFVTVLVFCWAAPAALSIALCVRSLRSERAVGKTGTS